MVRFGRFTSDVKGSTSMIFAMCLVSITLACGVAIDHSRRAEAQTRVAAIADSAVLAAVSIPDAPQADMEKAAKAFLDANAKTMDVDDLQPPKFIYDAAKAELTVEIKGSVPASLMSVAGLSKMEFTVKATAVRPSVPPIEMVMALDTTGSMAGTKIDALKTAASNMAKSILKNKDAKVGLVPFARYVNIGVSRRNMPYMDVPADYQTNNQSCSTSYPNATGCTTTRIQTTCTSTNDGVTSTYPCTRTNTTCSNWGQPVTTCRPATQNFTFRGCVGSREESFRARIDDETKKYPGFLNVNCGTEIEDLTGILGRVQSKIVQLSASDETYMPAGLTWGWNMLNPNHPLSSAQDKATLAAKGGKKVLVFMTDGANTLVPRNQNSGTHINPTNSTYYKNISTSNTLTANLCTAIKADGIEVYTVLFDVTDPAMETLLRNCASKPDMAYTASGSTELVAAFDKIVADLAQIRLTK